MTQMRRLRHCSLASVAAVELGDVRRVVDVLASAGVPYWVVGGWGVDALVGRPTRPHRDLDLALDATRFDDAVALVQGLGYVAETDWLPVRLELAKPGAGRVDLHPVAIDGEGHGRQAGLDGVVYHYPRVDRGIGWLAGRVVPCVSARLQRTSHAGYELRDVDRHDLAQLDVVDERHESALLVEIPAAEPAVGLHRAMLDHGAELGVPAHVTLLYPFAAQRDLSAQVVGLVEAVCADAGCFDVTFSRTEWFDDHVLWAAPDEPAPIRALTAALAAAFPAYPPYAGAYADVVPHLTIGDRPDPCDIGALREAERRVRPYLPITQRVSEISLYAGFARPGSWVWLRSFALR